MATYYLINAVTVNLGNGPLTLMPGTLIDSAQIATTAITAVGGLLYASSDADVAAAAVIAAAAKSKGANEAALEAIMRDGVANSQNAAAVAHDTVVSTSLTVKREVTLAGAVLPAKGVTVHASVAAGAPVNITTAFTMPFPRRSLQITLGVGGTTPVYTVTGTAPDGTALVKTATFAAASTVDVGAGADIFETITSVTSDINPGGTTIVKTGDGFGIGAFDTVDVFSCDGVVESVAVTSTATGGVKPTTAPNGTHCYSARASLAVAHTHTLS